MPLVDLRAAAGSDGFRPAVCYEGTGVATLIALAAADHGLTVLPGAAVAAAPGRHRGRPRLTAGGQRGP
jgi:DNA-binding transcriptional LysR family regulator